MSADPLFDVAGRRVLVTGGLGQIGTEFVRAFQERGATVFVASRSVTQQALEERFGDTTNLVPMQLDITAPEDVRARLSEVARDGGPITIVVNNAGLDTQPSAPPEVSGPFEDFPVEIFREVIEVNLTGTFIVTQAAGAVMRDHGVGGSIINVGSIYGMLSPIQDIYAYRAEQGQPFTKPVAYSAAKSGIYNLTRYAATYWGRHGIRVNTLTPSGVRRDTQDATFQANYTARMPIGRMAEADEFNGAVIFLASDASRYVTGSNLVVDGGWTAW
ncbi:short-chain dehydrogenase [Tessaracoccus aquimaris]|uniref:Short-chain dehydrogenase n=1 Tax=Tessaracoccus aquimaris TaxID=1332264 RepID=A0A1Q2CPP5_9ACTN|nr:SDR family oxidoreductase [Tessaracoccus aquimaris]AQP48082.1 short-chain dehydrogenase [Tessaracoccus aquimaris]